MRKIKLVSTLIINLFFYALGNIIPKSKNLWLFGAWYGNRYSDNSKAFFEYINNEQPHINAVWICKDSQVIEQVRILGFKAFHEKSLIGLWYQLSAEFVFMCQSLHDDIYSPCIGKNTTVVNLWHGLPLKKIMYDVFGDKATKKNFIGRLFDKLSPYNKHRNDIVIATSVLTQELIAQAFRVSKDQVVICGFPRNDIFFENLENKDNTIFNCIYMPTFRGGIGTECDLFARYGFNITQIEAELVKHNIQLTLRMHPVNKPPSEIVEQINKSKVIKLDNGDDIYQTIHEYDCLITDYSSIYFDFLLSNKPIVFAPFDLVEYKERERALYFEFEEVTLAPYCSNWEKVISRVVELKTDNLEAGYQEQYQALKLKFHNTPSNISKPFSSQLYQQLIEKKDNT
tara:strand:- start:110 stop:1306 length:1197 start_codon:yes stop_codon:yes gene_type:complete